MLVVHPIVALSLISVDVAQNMRGPVYLPAQFRVDSRMVMVPVTVTDRRGSVVSGLPREMFTISENGERREILSFAEEEAAASIGIVVDRSGSMVNVLNDAKAALRSVADFANPGDEAFLVTVSRRPELVEDFTEDLDGLTSRLVLTGSRGSTSLFDAVDEALTRMKSASHRRKAIIVLSDGMDNNSRATLRQLMGRVVESDLQIHTVCFYDPQQGAKPVQVAEQSRGALGMEEMASRSGGLFYAARDGADLRRSVEEISRAIRSHYSLGYAPGLNGESGRWRRIRVKLNESGFRVHARPGYRAD